MENFKILVLADGGIGGTEKAASIYAVELSRRGHQVSYSGNRGPRTSFLENGGVVIIEKANDASSLASLIDRLQPDLIHQHAPGYPIENPIYGALKLARSKPKFIQTNVFGHLTEPRALEAVDFHLFISKASGSQAFRRSGIPLDERWLQKSSVVMYPLPSSQPPDPVFRQVFRRENEVSNKTLLAIRIGQPGPGKWTDWEVKAAIAATKRGADIKLILMQPPDELLPKFKNAIDRGLLIILPATSDFNYLSNLYSAADAMLHASSFGESFGYTIAEGMAAGLPVICRSTPWGDSAQVELVENGLTGWTCATSREMGRRLVDLSMDLPKSATMGTIGKARIADLANLPREIDLLEEIIGMVVSGKSAPGLATRNQEFVRFHTQLKKRERTFSETRLPLSEKLEWYAYKLYRATRSRARKSLQWLRMKRAQ